MQYVIIGNSTAAVHAVESIRSIDKEGAITLISKEAGHTYSRPLISYLLKGKTTEEKMKYRDEDFYETTNCRLLSGQKVVKIEEKVKKVLLSDGTAVSYDKLLLATGSSPFIPPMQGLDQVQNQCTFSSLDDAKRLESMISADSRVLILGAGLIGLKCAEGIVERVSRVTVVDLAPRILSSILDEDAACMVQKHLESHGIRFRLGDSVSQFTPDEATLQKSGEKLPFDVLVVAVGVRPNVGLLSEIGGKVGRGIYVDDHMQTSVSDIYAAGDCTESVDVSTGDVKIMALLPNAAMQGECAGKNMAGEETVFDKAIPMNAIGFFGLHMLTAGSYQGESYAEQDETHYKKLFYQDNRLSGYILVGKIDRAGIYTSMVRERTPLDSVQFDLVCREPGLLAFSAEARAQKLGGVKVCI